MASYYSVVQYVPNPIADERINIGIIVYTDKEVLSRFISDFRRVKVFGTENISFVKDFISEIDDAVDLQQQMFAVHFKLNRQTIEEILLKWKNSIQFTPSRASLLDPEELMNQISPIFLPQPKKPSARKYPDKRETVKHAEKAIKTALIQQKFLVHPEDFIRRKVEIQGQLDIHKFDLAAINGKAMFAAQGLSFQSQDKGLLKQEVNATMWKVDDVRRGKDIPVFVITVPPENRSEFYDSSKRIFIKLGAEVIEKDQIDYWADNMAKRLVNSVS